MLVSSVCAGYVLSKHPNERQEYLVRQANDKCNHIRAQIKAANARIQQ